MIWFYLMIFVPLAAGFVIALATYADLAGLNKFLAWLTLPILIFYLLVTYLLFSSSGGVIWLPFIVVASLRLWPLLILIFFHAGWVVGKGCRNRIRTNYDYH